MEANYQDKIDMYLSGRMPFVDRLSFETELENNPELQEQYQFTLSLQAELQDRRVKQRLMNSWKEESNTYSGDIIDQPTVEATFVPLVNRKRIWYRRIGWSAAAVFLILLFISLPDAKEHHRKRNQEIAQAQVEKNATQSSHFLSNQSREVASHDLTSPTEKLSIQQQEKYWQRAQYYKIQGQREECIRCLRVLLQQEGIYHQKADSLLHVIYQSQQ